MIIAGYPGVGKTTCAKEYQECVDLESSWFHVATIPTMDWSPGYIKAAESLSQKGFIVFVSTHNEVVEKLRHTKEPVWICHPDESLRDDWCMKLLGRYSASRDPKDLRAAQHVVQNFEMDISNELWNDFVHLTIMNMSYDLYKLIQRTIKHVNM